MTPQHACAWLDGKKGRCSSMSSLLLPASLCWLDGKGTVGEMGGFFCGDKGFIVIPRASIHSTDQWPFSVHQATQWNQLLAPPPHNYRMESRLPQKQARHLKAARRTWAIWRAHSAPLANEEAVRGREGQMLFRLHLNGPNNGWFCPEEASANIHRTCQLHTLALWNCFGFTGAEFVSLSETQVWSHGDVDVSAAKRQMFAATLSQDDNRWNTCYFGICSTDEISL